MGAQLTGELYQQGSLTKNEAERLLAFCNNSGPLFILGTVGIGLFGNRSYGVLLLVCHIAAAVTVGLLLRFFAAKNLKSAPVAKAKRLSPLLAKFW